MRKIAVISVYLLYNTSIAFGDSSIGQANNTYLLYTDIYRSKFSSPHTPFSSFVEPYLVYRRKEGGKDSFFDTFVIADHFMFYHNKYTSTKHWWGAYINQVFGYPVGENCILTKPGYISGNAAALQIRESCLSRSIDVENDTIMLISLYCKNCADVAHTKGGYIGFVFYDADMREMSYDVGKMIWSDYLGVWYQYFETDSIWDYKSFEVVLPEHCARVEISIGSWMSDCLILDAISLKLGDSMVTEDFEKSQSVWRFDYFPRLKRMTAYGNILPTIDSILAVNSKENGENLTLNIILTIPWSYQSGKNGYFGVINEHDVTLAKKHDALLAVNWFVDECLDKWQKLKPKRLKLLGFYWLNEEGNDFKHIDLKKVTDGIHDRGYKLFGSCFNSLWQRTSFGLQYFQIFDLVWLQPNAWPPGYKTDSLYIERVRQAFELGTLKHGVDYVRNHGIPIDELAEINRIADALEAGIVIEWVAGQEKTLNYGRVLDYLNRDKRHEHNFMGKKILVFDDRGFGQYCCHSAVRILREQYDAVHDFVTNNRMSSD